MITRKPYLLSTLARLALVLVLAGVLAWVPTPAAHAATYNVSTEGQLNAAITDINTPLAGPHTINITADIALTGAPTAITNPTTITIEGNGHTVSQTTANRVFRIMADAAVTFNNITIRGGNASGGSGGGIYSEGATLTLTNSTVSGNTASDFGGGIFNGDGGTVNLTNSTVSGNTATTKRGGGIYNSDAMLNLTNSTVSGNTATISDGGGIFNAGGGTVNLTNSTVSGNTAGDESGGIYNENAEGTVNLTNSTVSGNTATSYGGIYNEDGTVNLVNSTVSGNTASGDGGGGIHNDDGTVNLTNTIIANQLAGGDCSGPVLATSNNYNLDSDGSCNLDQPNDKPNNLNANLGPLQVNAPGNTATHALLPGSDAIDTGDCSGGTITDDQRGVPRPQPTGGNCDIGAYELEQQPPEPVGGIAVPVNRLGLLAPWLGLAALAAVVALGVVLVRRRRSA